MQDAVAELGIIHIIVALIYLAGFDPIIILFIFQT